MMKGRKNVNKTVKHCSVCQENFGDRFSFCPVCGEPLKAVAVGQNEAFAAATTRDDANVRSEEVAAVTAPLTSESAQEFARQAESANGSANYQANQIFEKSFEPPKKTVNVGNGAAHKAANRANGAQPLKANAPATGDGLYHLTMLETPPTYSRYLSYGALFGLFFLLTSGIALLIADIYAFNLGIVDPIDEVVYVPLPDDGEAVLEEEEAPKKDEKKGGGGGGGGNEDKKPPSRGVDAAQMRSEPLMRPSVTMHQLENPAIKVQMTTVGDKPKTEMGPYGIKSSTSDDPSDGTGRGGGQGTGLGGGQGSGNGTGKGTGDGSGSGSGSGNGNGSGTGNGSGRDNDAPTVPEKPKAPAIEKLVITSKPRADYTEDARKNQISGTVRLRVTLAPSGQVTNVSVVSGLPYGLTEKAIAAARLIRFTPEKRNGVPVAVNKVVEYNFNLY